MDTARWQERSEFAVLDLVAALEFRTGSSLSFLLGTKSGSAGRVFTIIGWLDVHHPCEGFHRLHLRVGLPDPTPLIMSVLSLRAQASRKSTSVDDNDKFPIYLNPSSRTFPTSTTSANRVDPLAADATLILLPTLPSSMAVASTLIE